MCVICSNNGAAPYRSSRSRKKKEPEKARAALEVTDFTSVTCICKQGTFENKVNLMTRNLY